MQIHEQALTRLLNGCTKSLQVFRLQYSCLAFTLPAMVVLAKCAKLKDLQLGDVTDKHTDKVLKSDRIALVKRMLGARKFQLE